MQPPIPIGNILQNRYRLLSILGQGGFGRTYLAEDLGRFQERCALKEFIPTQSNAHVIEKSKELFQREAAVLYQIQHPQIPQFRANFEENQRLFLVQDYVEGKTYRELLEERKIAGSRFSETEVLVFLRQMLPVLAHIHAKGIIHRDISPDNVILRTSDRLPVLIDFGVVKELATRLQGDPAMPATSVGKVGYAPVEQMQTGQATPSSDLYALAVTTVVLLTAKEPQELLDRTTLIWNWQQWAPVSAGLALVLNRMLSRSPSDRFASVREVAQALDEQANSLPQPPVATPQPVPPSVSEVATMAVGRRPDPVGANPYQPNPDPGINPPTSSFWDNPVAVMLLGTILVILTGVGSWALVSSVLKSQRKPPRTTPTPAIVIPTSEPRPTPTPVQPVLTPKPTPSLTPEPIPEPTFEPAPIPPSDPLIPPTPEPIPSLEPTPEPIPSLEPTPEPIPSLEPTSKPEPTPTPKPTPSPTPKPEPTPSPKPTPSLTPKPEPTPTPTPVPTPTPTPTLTPEPSPIPSIEPSPSISPTPPENTPQPSPSL